MSMLSKVRSFINKERLLEHGDRVLIAVSGGADSCALLHSLYELKHEYQLSLKVIHVNHLFRGNEAKEDGEFVQRIAARYGVEAKVFEVPVGKIAKAEKISKQTAGRKVRYDILNKEAVDWRATKIALGHHANDQGETVLMHLLRGSGLQGLGGIHPKRDQYIRPLLLCTREEVENYCRDRHIEYREDSSNQSTEYLRNRIRLKLIPYLTKQYNPRIVEALSRTAELLQWDQSYLCEQVNYHWQECLVDSGEDRIVFSLAKTQGLAPAISSRLVSEAWKNLSGSFDNLEFQQINSVLKLINDGQTGKVIELPERVRVLKSYDTVKFYMEINQKTEQGHLWSYQFEYPGVLRIRELNCVLETSLLSRDSVKIGDGLLLDENKLPRNLVVRTRRAGDWFKPLGSGKKKLKEYFIDKKVPRDERDKMLLLVTEDQEVVVIIGDAISENYKLEKSTTKVVRIRVN